MIAGRRYIENSEGWLDQVIEPRTFEDAARACVSREADDHDRYINQRDYFLPAGR